MAETCETCGGALGMLPGPYLHDHKPDGSGLDDGPYLPGQAPRKKPAPKPADVMASVRARAWATRRAKYGQCGNRKYASPSPMNSGGRG